MDTFTYTVIDRNGTLTAGRIESLDARNAAVTLRERGYVVVDIEPLKQRFNLEILQSLQKISEVEKTNFTRLLATMISTGLPITLALQNLVDQTENQKFRMVIADILRDIQSGSSLSQALDKHGDVFSPIYINMVRTGEESGNLDKTLLSLAETLEREREFKSKLKSAMIYPVIVTVAMVGVAVLMMVMVVPKIASVYSEADAALPLPTRLLILASDIVTKFWLPVLIISGGVFLFVRSVKKTVQGEKFFNQIFFNLPVFGKLNRQVILTRMTRTLSVLVSSGVAILDGLRLTAETLGNNSYRDSVNEAATGIERGASLSASFIDKELYPPIISQMVAVGEDTGTLDEVLMKLSIFFETETEYALKNLTAVLEPLIIIVLGVGVAGLATAIILPLFNLVNVIR